MTEAILALVEYRLEQADESLESSQILFDSKKYRPSVNRSYYAMFYAILALLAVTKQQASQHSWVITLFDRDFVKKGPFDKEFSRWLHEAFDLKQRADYREMFVVTPERAEIQLQHASDFVLEVKKQLNCIDNSDELTES